MLQLTGSWKTLLQPCLSALPCVGSSVRWGKGFGGLGMSPCHPKSLFLLGETQNYKHPWGLELCSGTGLDLLVLEASPKAAGASGCRRRHSRFIASPAQEGGKPPSCVGAALKGRRDL